MIGPGSIRLDETLGSLELESQVQRLRTLSENSGSSKNNLDNLEKAAKEFEGVFLGTLMRAMRKTVPDNELFNSSGPTKFYQQMHDAEIAKALAAGHSNMGIADLIVKQFADTVGDADQDSGLGGKPTPASEHVPAQEGIASYRRTSHLAGSLTDMALLHRQAELQGPAVADTLLRYQNELEQAARSAGVKPALLLSVVMVESGGDAQAVSRAGAKGLMQLMPGTAADLGVKQPEQPEENLLGGARYLSQMLTKFEGRVDLALAAYNAGPGTVARYGNELPPYPETRQYVQKVLELYKQLAAGTEMASE